MEFVQDDSFLAIFFAQPVVIWTFVIGAVILLVAATMIPLLNFIQNRKEKREKLAARRKAPPPPSPEIERVIQALAEEDDSIDLETELGLPQESRGTAGSQVVAVNKFEAISVPDDKASFVELDKSDPGAAGVGELNKKEEEPAAMSDEDSLLASIFEEEIIVDPLLQAMRDNLDPVDINHLIENVSATLAEIKTLVEKNETRG